jgi:hypothetical protein
MGLKAEQVVQGLDEFYGRTFLNSRIAMYDATFLILIAASDGTPEKAAVSRALQRSRALYSGKE